MPRHLALWAALLATGCRFDAPPDPAARARLQAALAHDFAAGPLDLVRFEDRATRLPGYRVTPVQFSLRPGRPVAAALFEPDAPTDAGVLVAHGHFGQGKSAPESQAIAHRLAARGARVLVVDTPGMEEWDQPDQQLHFEGGAHARGFLAAGGTSALALQVAILRRGLDALQGTGARRIAATGASGGAVQSLYLLLADPRVQAAVLASFPPMPREARAGGCACDQVPGWPGPDPALMSLVDRPTLWLADGHDDRPPGLPRAAVFRRLEAPHSYDVAMQDAALAFLGDQLDLPAGDAPTPNLDLATPGPGAAAAAALLSLPLPGAAPWVPTATVGSGRLSVELSCEGAGPTVLTAGATALDRAALGAVGLRACQVTVSHDEVGLAEGIATGEPYAGRLATALRDAAQLQGAQGIYAVRAWAVPAAGAGLPFAVRGPIDAPGDLILDQDPAWVHVPGVWWGGMDAVRAAAVGAGDAATAAEALARSLTPPSSPGP